MQTKNILVAQSGGPSSAINATLAGVVESGIMSTKIGSVYGAVNGVKGILEERIIELNDVLSSAENLKLLSLTPASALGSCRMKLKGDDEFDTIIKIFREYNIGYFVYIGGNDSMDTVYKLSQYCINKGIDDIKIMGAPKTIDNDLCETDHCPGFGSAAKYIATTFAELGRDCGVYDIPAVTVVEVMGRDAGWLTASSALARINGGTAPDLIYLCEREFDIDRFISDVKNILSEKPDVLIAVSEGIKTSDGKYVSESSQSVVTDEFGHTFLSGAGEFLKNVIRDRIGCKVRSVELNLMQRCASHIASAVDIHEARMLGSAALNRALEGGTGEMAALERISSNPYSVEFKFVDISNVANYVKQIPLEWINDEGNDVTNELIEYMLPLIQGEIPVVFKNGVPVHINLY